MPPSACSLVKKNSKTFLVVWLDHTKTYSSVPPSANLYGFRPRLDEIHRKQLKHRMAKAGEGHKGRAPNFSSNELVAQGRRYIMQRSKVDDGTKHFQLKPEKLRSSWGELPFLKGRLKKGTCEIPTIQEEGIT